MRCLPQLSVAFSLMLSCADPAASLAQWAPDGNPVCIAPNAQDKYVVRPDGSGGAFIAWEDSRNGAKDIYAQRITNTGAIAPGWPVDGVVVCQAVDDQQGPDLAPDGAGGVFIVWADLRSIPSGVNGEFEIWMTRLSEDGSLSPGWTPGGSLIGPRIGGFDQTQPSLISDGAGGVLVAWSGSEGVPFIRVLRVMGSGATAAGWESGPLRISLRHSSQSWPQMTSDGASGAIVTWIDESGGSIQTYVQRVTAARTIPPGWPSDGLAIGNGGQVGNENGRPRIVADGTGGVFVGWGDISGGDWETRIQRIAGDGTISPRWSPTGTIAGGGAGHQYAPQIAASGTGDAFACWIDTRNGNNDVYAQRISGAGLPAAGWPPNGLALCDLPSSQLNPTVDSDGIGGAFFAWHDFRNNPVAADIYGMALTEVGGVRPGWTPQGIGISLASASQLRPALARTASGRAIVAWSDARNGSPDVYAAVVGADGPTPALLSLLDTDVQSGQVRIRWWGKEATADVYRRQVESDWQKIARISADGSGYLVYTDHDVVAGGRYGYRLGIPSAGEEAFLGEVWIDTPTEVGFALFGSRPNPSAGNLQIMFSLGTSEPVHLELFDVRGRRIDSVDLTAPSVGPHSVNLAAGQQISPGVYAVRLTQGSRVKSMTAVVGR